MRAQIPHVSSWPSMPREFYRFLQDVASNANAAATTLDTTAINLRITELEESVNSVTTGKVIGASSVESIGALPGVVFLSLAGDSDAPGNTCLYGTDASGVKGWIAVSDALAASSNIALTVGTDGVTTFDLADLADSGTGAALVKLTRDSKGRISGTSAATTSDLAEGTNLYYTDARASAAAPVQSVNGYAGAVALTASDVGAATTAQGAKADSAVQSIVAGTGVSVDATDPHNPVVSATGSGSGDVVGPASATDGDVALFDGTTGKLIKSAGGSFGALVRAAVLTGLSTATSAALAATDTVLQAFGKIQAQITDNLLPKGYIDGLQMQWVSGTALTVSSGAAYIEGSSKVLRATSAIAKTGLSLTASTWYHFYLYDNAGTPDAELSTTAPAAPYNGTARSKTGDTSRRYIGSVRTDSTGALFKFYVSLGEVFYLEKVGVRQFLVAGTATSPTAVSFASLAPDSATFITVAQLNSSATTAVIDSSDMNYSPGSARWMEATGNSNFTFSIPLPASRNLSYYYVSAPSSGALYLTMISYRYER